jgi:hypothetical protein
MSMNLHAIVNPIIQVINSNVPAWVRYSTGSLINIDGTQTPTYSEPVLVSAQVQNLTYRDLTQIEGLNLQGTKRAIYLFGPMDSVERLTCDGGDLILFPGRVGSLPAGTTWLVAQTLEDWLNMPDCWTKVAATLQMDTGGPPGGTLVNP